MTFLNGEIQDRDGAVLVSVQGFDLKITGPKADAARKHAQKSVILGVRPSDLLYSPDAPGDEALSLDVAVSRVCRCAIAPSLHMRRRGCDGLDRLGHACGVWSKADLLGEPSGRPSLR